MTPSTSDRNLVSLNAWGPPDSKRQTAARSFHALLHYYATKAPLITMGRPKFTPKTTPSFPTITTLSNTPIHRPIPLAIPTASGCTQPFCHSTLSGQPDLDRPTDRKTDRQNDSWGRRQVRKISAYARLIESDALITMTFDGLLLERQWRLLM